MGGLCTCGRAGDTIEDATRDTQGSGTQLRHADHLHLHPPHLHLLRVPPTSLLAKQECFGLHNFLGNMY